MTSRITPVVAIGRTARRITVLVTASLLLAGVGCQGLLLPSADTSLDGRWRITVFPPGSAAGEYIATIVIAGGEADKLTGLPGVPAQFAAMGFGDIPLRGNSINLFNVLVITGNGTLTVNGSAVTLAVVVSGSVAGQPLEFSATLDGNLTSEGVIEGTARLDGALFAGESFQDPNASIAFQMVRE